MLTKMRQMFNTIFNSEEVLKIAREVGAVKRLRNIVPKEFATALVNCAMGDETRSIATARRAYSMVSGYTPEESSFYDRFNAGSVALMKRLFEIALRSTTKQHREALSAALDGSSLVDIEAIDGSQIALPSSASDKFPSTCKSHGGIKLTATLSVLFNKIKSIHLTDAKTHDRRALKLSRWLHGRLILLDRGYTDHRLWASIEDRGGFFLTPLKKSATPQIENIRSGVGKQRVGEELSSFLRYRKIVDIDAEFSVRKKGRRTFRVVRVSVQKELPDGRREVVKLWFVTNLPPDLFTPEQLATIYRFRWEVEQLFRTLKMVGRLDHLQSASPSVIHTFIYATLLGMALSHDLCSMMRRKSPHVEPSPHRVTAILLTYLPSIIEALCTRKLTPTLKVFEKALWREGVNPNPGRPYRSTIYAKELCRAS